MGKTNDLETNLLIDLMDKGELSGKSLEVLSNSTNNQVASKAKFLLQSPKELFYAVFNMQEYEHSGNKTEGMTEAAIEDMRIKSRSALARLKELAFDLESYDLKKGYEEYNRKKNLCYILPFSNNNEAVGDIGRYSETPVDVLRYIVNGDSPYAKAGAARNISIPEELMQVLVKETASCTILTALALNKRTPDYIIDILSYSYFLPVREIAARSLNANAETLTRLLHGKDLSIRILALRNSNLPYTEVLKIAEMESEGELFEYASKIIEKNKRKSQRELVEKATVLAIQNGLLNEEELILLSELNLEEGGYTFAEEIVKNSIVYMKTH